MSLSLTRTLLNASSKLVRCSSQLKQATGRVNTALYAGIQSENSAGTLTRSLGTMCRRADDTRAQKHNAFCRCGCRGLHTQGDQTMASFLQEEIASEKNSLKTPSASVKGFEITARNGAEVTLQKKHENETITITLNVNGTVDDEPTPYDDELPKDDEGSKMVSKPPFRVEISKGGDSTLNFQCNFPPAGEEVQQNPESGEQYEDLIEVEEVTFLKKGEKWGDQTYSVMGAILDGNLYDMLLGLLEERGIDGPFVQQLIDYATTYEHTQYVNFLESLRDFANAK